MDDNENLDAETRQKVQDIKTRRIRDILQMYQDVMSCQCNFNISLETDPNMDSNTPHSYLTPMEKWLCFLVVLLIALVVYAGCVVKSPKHECGCSTTKYF